jgi:hypothetical protein
VKSFQPATYYLPSWKLTPAQWSDAFRAAGYNEMDTQRYVIRLRQKVTEGLSVSDVL